MARISRCFRRCDGGVSWYTVWMSSYRPTATRVLRLRVKDKHASWLSGLAREVNTVFNYCNELSVKVFERERRFFFGVVFLPVLTRATRRGCVFYLSSQSVAESGGQYARRGTPHRKKTIERAKGGGGGARPL